jgi:hypothetical protein
LLRALRTEGLCKRESPLGERDDVARAEGQRGERRGEEEDMFAEWKAPAVDVEPGVPQRHKVARNDRLAVAIVQQQTCTPRTSKTEARKQAIEHARKEPREHARQARKPTGKEKSERGQEASKQRKRSKVQRAERSQTDR